MKNIPDLMQRFGRFKISAELLRAPSPELQDFMSYVIVVRCEMDFATDKLSYTALSLFFETVPENSVYPDYSIGFARPTRDYCPNCQQKWTGGFTVRKL